MDSGVIIYGIVSGTKIKRSRISGKPVFHFFGTISTGNLRYTKMKRGFTILLLLLTTTCRAQNSPEVSNLSLTDSSLRILYIGVDNYLQITGIKKPEDLEVTISGGATDIRQYEASRYVVRTSVVGQSTLSIFLKGKLLKRIEYNVYTLGPAVAGVNYKRNTTLRKNEILEAPRINLFVENAKLRLNDQVVSFTMYLEMNGDSFFIPTQGNQLNQQQLNTIRQLSGGATLFFDDIRVKGPDSRTTKAEPFWIKIE